VARLPTKLVAGPFVDIDAVDVRDHLPAPARIFCFINRNAAEARRSGRSLGAKGVVALMM